MATLAVGGPMDQQLISRDDIVVWVNDRPAYYRRLVRNNDKCQWLYLHRSVMSYPPNPESVIRKFIQAKLGVDLAVLTHYWWTVGDSDRYAYARFL
jgi:hypothetical protein